MNVATRGNGEGDGRSEELSAGMRLRRRSLMLSAAIAAAVCGAIASRRIMDWAPRDSNAITVPPATRRVRTPHELCKSEEVRHVRPALDPRDVAGNHIDHPAPADDSYTTTEEHCVTVYETETVPRG